jgi:hypothetical protein
MVWKVSTANTNYVQEADYALETWTAAQKAAPSEPTSSTEGHHAFKNSGELTIPQGKKISYFGQNCRQITLLHVKVREAAANVTCDATLSSNKLQPHYKCVLDAPKSLNKDRTDECLNVDHQGRQTLLVGNTTGSTANEGVAMPSMTPTRTRRHRRTTPTFRH